MSRWLLFIVACKPEVTPPVDVDTDADADTDTDSDADTDADTDTDSDTDVDTCADDAFEPNETPQTAVALEDANDLVVCRSSADFWSTDVAPGEALTAQVSTTSGVLDLYLASLGGTSYDVSSTGTGFDVVHWYNGGSSVETVVAEVRAVGTEPALYDLQVDRMVCADDLLDGESEPLVSGAFATTPASDDVWTFTSDQAATVEVEITWQHDEFDLRLSASALTYAGPGRAVSWFRDIGFVPIDLVATVSQVSGGCGSYDLELRRLTDCDLDWVESTGLPGLPLDLHGAEGLGVQDIDYWYIELPPDSVAMIDVLPSAGIVPTLDLLRITGDLDTVQSPFLLSNPTDAPVGHSLQVRLGSGTSVPCGDYQITAERSGCSIDDASEPNGNATEASSALIGSIAAGGDEDWIALGTAQMGQTFELTLRAAADLDVELLDAQGTVFAATVTADPSETLRWTNLGPPIDVFARVVAFEVLSCDVPYELTSP